MNENKEILKDIAFKNLINEGIDEKQYFQLRTYINENITDEKASILIEQGNLTYKRKAFHSGVNSALTVMGILASAAVGKLGVPMWFAYRISRMIYDKCTKSCGVFNLINSLRRQICLTQCKVKSIEAMIKTIKQGASKCQTSECKEKAEKNIKKLERKLVKAEKKLTRITQYAKSKNVSTDQYDEKDKDRNIYWKKFKK